jgi:hypothetical protein
LTVNKYVVWNRDDIKGLPEGWRLLYTEVCSDGTVEREIALDADGRVVYRAPSAEHPRLLFDLAVVDVREGSQQIHPESFERLWKSTSDREA